jgi:CTP synthase (UTP-ammonia lyase)
MKFVKLDLAIVGDFNADFKPHPATNEALSDAANTLAFTLNTSWLPTRSLIERNDSWQSFDGFLIAPGSPYESMKGALNVIEFARNSRRPVLGTCGGFQHIVIEYARNVLNLKDAEHAEYNPYTSNLLISKLECSLVGQLLTIQIKEDSGVFRIYKKRSIREHYYCNFGLNPEYQDALDEGGLRVVGVDENNEARILELADHLFYVATLFVPQLNSSLANPHPLLLAFLQAMAGKASSDTHVMGITVLK